MKSKRIFPLSLLLIALFFSCNDDSGTIGFSVDTTSLSIYIDSSYVYSQHTDSVSTFPVDSLPNRTIVQMLGDVTIPGYGRVKADYLTQFYPVAEFDTTLVKPDMIDSVGVEIAFQYNSFFGDSLAPMQLTVYELNKLLRDESNVRVPIYSYLNPADYYDPADKLGSSFYVASTQSYPDSLLDDDGYRFIKQTFGNTASEKKAWAKKFYDFYLESGGNITTSAMNQLFKGLYITNTFGHGTLLYIISTAVVVYHRTYAYDSSGGLKTVSDDSDVLYVENASTTYLMTSYEAPTINHIEASPAASVDALRAQGEAVIQSPQMYDGTITFPTAKIIETFNSSRSLNSTDTVGVLNTINMTIPLKTMPADLKALGIVPPPYLLLMRKGGNATSSTNAVVPMNIDEFFAVRLINDDKNYFYAAYDSTSNSYTFTGLQNYIMNIFEYDPNHILNPDDSLNPSADYSYDSDMILVPITVSKTTSSYTTDTSIVPYLGGLTYANIDNENIRIQVVYSTKIY